MISKALLLSTIAALTYSATPATAKTYYVEKFDDGQSGFEQRWVKSTWKTADGTDGTFKLTAGNFYGDAEEAVGVETSQDARFYAYTSKFDTAFDNTNSDLVLQFQVKHPQQIDCGGGYIKLLPHSVNQKSFDNDSPYYVMFGPDVCGTSTKKTHVILNYKGDNKLIKKNIQCETDQLSHVYTLHLKPDQTYEVYIDGEKKEQGSLLDDWDFLPAKRIKDPSVSKPSDWVDEAMIDDPEDVKPADYDSTPKQIPDPDAAKPDDWDDESDGEWEAPQIDNPEYKGAWKAKRIANPEYKGAWTHPEIDNPDYKEDDSIGKFTDIGAVGFELWQVKAGSIFDNIIVTDSLSEAEALRDETWGKNHAAEKEALAARDKKNADAAAAASKVADTTSEDDDEDDDDDDHDEL